LGLNRLVVTPYNLSFPVVLARYNLKETSTEFTQNGHLNYKELQVVTTIAPKREKNSVYIIYMPNLKPFRDYSEHFVLNIFSCNTVATKGTLVKPVRSWKDNGGTDSSTAGPLNLTSTSVGQKFNSTLNNFFDINASVTITVNYNDTPKPIGILLKDVKEEDENGNLLVYNPRKVAEMDVAVKDYQAVPILTKGLILVNDIDISRGGGDPDLGDAAYAGDNGKIATNGTILIGTFLSPKDENGYCLVNLNMG